MSRVIISGSPEVALRAKVAEDVNEAYNRLTSNNIHRDLAHAQKRLEASNIASGGEASKEFQVEADLMGISALELAAMILSKPNEAAARELERRKLLIKIAAGSIEELKAIMSEINGGQI